MDLLNDFVIVGLLKAFAIAVGLQVVGFTLSTLLDTDKLFDFFGTGTFISLSIFSFYIGENSIYSNQKKTVAIGLLLVWAIRLGLFLIARVFKAGKDKRFDEYKKKKLIYFGLWMGQAMWSFIVGSPIYITLMKPKINLQEAIEAVLFSNITIKIAEIVGLALFAFGYIFEVISDQQKKNFRKIEENKTKFISSGLWSISRHPNYFGEIMLWLGINLYCGITFTNGYEFIFSVFSPMFIIYALNNKTGIPILEDYAKKKWGKQKDFQKYIKETPILIPFCSEFALKIMNLIVFIGLIIISALLPSIYGVDMKEISDKFPTLFVPDGFTFSIWGIIYLFQSIALIVAVFKKNRTWTKQIGSLFIINQVVTVFWLISFHECYFNDAFLIHSELLMLLILYTAILIYQKLDFVIKKNPFEVYGAFSIYLGWLCIATIANTAFFIKFYLHFTFGKYEKLVTAGVIFVGMIIEALFVVKDNRFDLFPSLVGIWAFFGILRQRKFEKDIIFYTLFVCIFSLAILFVYGLIRLILKKRKKKKKEE